VLGPVSWQCRLSNGGKSHRGQQGPITSLSRLDTVYSSPQSSKESSRPPRFFPLYITTSPQLLARSCQPPVRLPSHTTPCTSRPLLDTIWRPLTLSSTAQNARASPLLRLPAELRNHICSYIFVEETLTIYKDSQSKSNDPAFSYRPCSPPLWRGLLRTCRQLDHETTLVPFKATIFRFTVSGSFVYFINAISKHRQPITSIRLEWDTRDPLWDVAKGTLIEVLPGLRRVEALLKHPQHEWGRRMNFLDNLRYFMMASPGPTAETLYSQKITELRRRFVYGGDGELEVVFVQSRPRHTVPMVV
jgi:hypothetical protein